ncbi:MAG: DUF1194 domain-containing protein [Rhodospirillaceae bacterium]|nr:DUF1194 domain-containing protein [Rhodospirillaceae bacterium]
MRHFTCKILPLALAVAAGLVRPAPAAEKLAVDLALVLAVDVSLSVDEGEKGLQRVGYIAAWREKRVADAIKNGPIGKIAVTFVEWSSPYQQAVVIPWRIVDGPATAKAFADELEKAPITPGTTTSISGGIDFAVKLLQKREHDAARMVIDVSGDGYSDVGRPVTEARDAAVKAGVTINGLPVMNEDPKKNAAPPDLDTYYRDNVIGGPGSFYVTTRNVEGFKESLLKKLVLEIAGLTPEQAAALAER